MSKYCLHCCSTLPASAKKFCASNCQHAYHWQHRKTIFEKTGSWPNTKNETAIARNVKRYVKELRGHICEICGLRTWCDKEIPLVLDHIDGNSSNSALNNVRLVCGNCDMQLPTYKSKNYGRGRFARRTRYKRGQSY